MANTLKALSMQTSIDVRYVVIQIIKPFLYKKKDVYKIDKLYFNIQDTYK